MKGGPRLSRIGQIAIPVQDVPRAVEFYRDTLGMEFQFQVPGMAFLNCAGVRLMLSAPEGPGSDQRSSVLYYQVDDLGGAAEALSERGVEVVEEPHLVARMSDHDLWMGFFKDSEGNILALMSEEPSG